MRPVRGKGMAERAGCPVGGKRLFIPVLLLFLYLAAGMADAGTVMTGTSTEVARYFERAKRNEAELIAFLHKMPKGADLHNHPSGTVNTETLLDNAIRQDLLFDRTTSSFVRQTEHPHYTSRDLMYDFWKAAEVLDALSMRNPEKQPESGHTHFFRAFDRFAAAMPDSEALMDELIGRAVSQRIGYMELMTNVVRMPDGPADFAAMCRELDEFDRLRRRALYRRWKGGERWNVDVGYTLTLNRNGVPAALRERFDASAYEAYFRKAVRDAMRLVANLSDCGVRGITLLSPEDAWFSRNYFDLQMRVIDEEWSRLTEEERRRVRLNLHAGELTIEYSPYEVMRNRIRSSIELGHASRIGHGVAVMWEDDVYGLLRHMRNEGIAVEICLTSNSGILKMAGGERHPFRLYWQAGVPLVLCTDDEGISRSNLTMEYVRAAQWFGLRYGELKWLAFNSLEYSFLPGESMFREGDYNRRKVGSDFPRDSRKAAKQRELWEAFEVFERDMEENIRLLR